MKTSALYFHIAEAKLRTGRTKRRKTMFQIEFKPGLKTTILTFNLWKSQKNNYNYIYNLLFCYYIFTYILFYTINENHATCLWIIFQIWLMKCPFKEPFFKKYTHTKQKIFKINSDKLVMQWGAEIYEKVYFFSSLKVSHEKGSNEVQI